METRIIKDKISREELRTLASSQFGNVIKAVVDIGQEIMGVGGEFHSEIEALLISEEGSERENTWGINLALDETGEEFIEFDSMINLKPLLGNKTRDVEDPEIRRRVRDIINRIVAE